MSEPNVAPTDKSLVKFRITKTGAYFYHRKGTLSFSWRYRMPWRPEWCRDSSGWFFGFWKFGLEWLSFDDDDPWGERHIEDLASTWNMLVDELESEAPK